MEAKQKIEAAATATTSSSVTFCATGCGEIATLRCPRCLGARYCSKECGKIAWPEHKGPCKEAAKVMGGIPIDMFDIVFEENKRRAEAGNAEAQYSFGVNYASGTGVAVDKREAFKWFTLAAKAGSAKAQNTLAHCYQQGNGVDIDLSEAFKWFKDAGEAGSIEARSSLGFCYENGIGVAVDMHKAIKFYTSSSRRRELDCAVQPRQLLQAGQRRYC
jgi:TPR repeat protein